MASGYGYIDYTDSNAYVYIIIIIIIIIIILLYIYYIYIIYYIIYSTYISESTGVYSLGRSIIYA